VTVPAIRDAAPPTIGVDVTRPPTAEASVAGIIGSLKVTVNFWPVPAPCPPHPTAAGYVESTVGGTPVGVAVGVALVVAVAVEVAEAGEGGGVGGGDVAGAGAG